MRLISVRRKTALAMQEVFHAIRIIETPDSPDLVNVEISEVLRIGVQYDQVSYMAKFYMIDNPAHTYIVKSEDFWMLEIM